MSRKAAGWIITLVILACILAGLWLAVNGGFKGSLSGTIAKIRTYAQKTPAEDTDTQTPTPESPLTADSQKPDEKGADQTGTFPQIPFLGTPGLGIPSPIPGADKTALQPQTPSDGVAPDESVAGGISLSGSTLKTPTDVLKACVDSLKRNDLVGCEKYVSPNGMTFAMGSTIGVHEILWKGIFNIQAYQGIGYNSAKISGQTALIPLYADLGETRTIVAYVVMAHRGDGWKLDHITDPSRF